MPHSEGPLAWFITFTTHGSWLHGDERGSVDRDNNAFDTPPLAPDQGRQAYIRSFRGTGGVVRLDTVARSTVDAAIRDVCSHRGWELYALNVRTNHVHTVLAADTEPEKVMATLKAWATRRLVEAGSFPAGIRPWTRHGSTRYLWTERDVAEACTYVVEAQGPALTTVEVGATAGRSLTVAALKAAAQDGSV